MLEFNATFLVAMLSFAVFMMIMNAIFYNPILNIIRKRDEYIGSNYENAKRLEAEAKESKDTYTAKIEQTQDECRHEIRNAVAKAHSIANSKISEAKQMYKSEIQAQKDAVIQKGQALTETVKSSVVKNLANDIVAKVTGDSIDTEFSDLAVVNRILD